MTSRRTALKLGTAVAGSFMINRGALAVDSIRVIVPWGQGAQVDHLFQLIQGPFTKAMGMPVVIDFVTGDELSPKVGDGLICQAAAVAV